jgi:hypothetical protein
VKWYQGYAAALRQEILAPKDAIYQDFWRTQFKLHPLASCPKSCSYRGVCVTLLSNADAKPHCLCYYGWAVCASKPQPPNPRTNLEPPLYKGFKNLNPPPYLAHTIGKLDPI